MTSLLEWFVRFVEQNPDFTAIAIGLFIAWGATFAFELVFIPESWTQHQCVAYATGLSMIVCAVWTTAFWRLLDPSDGWPFALFAGGGVAMCAPFVYWALSKLITWKWPGLDLTFQKGRASL